jgi:hypothetical protein
VAITVDRGGLEPAAAAAALDATALCLDAGGDAIFHVATFATFATMLVAIDDGADTAVHRFEDTSTSSTFAGSGAFTPDLTLLATLQGTASTTTSGYFFTPG